MLKLFLVIITFIFSFSFSIANAGLLDDVMKEVDKELGGALKSLEENLEKKEQGEDVKDNSKKNDSKQNLSNEEKKQTNSGNKTKMKPSQINRFSCNDNGDGTFSCHDVGTRFCDAVKRSMNWDTYPPTTYEGTMDTSSFVNGNPDIVVGTFEGYLRQFTGETAYFKKGMPHGKGKITCRSTGYDNDGNVIFYTNNLVYEGDIKYGHAHGQGKMSGVVTECEYFNHGICKDFKIKEVLYVSEGEFDQSIFINGKHQDKVKKIDYVVRNEEWTKVVAKKTSNDRSSRGNWGIKFNMNVKDVLAISTLEGCELADGKVGNAVFCNGGYTIGFRKGNNQDGSDTFVDFFRKRMAEYTYSGMSEFHSKLKKKYKVLKTPSAAETEQFITCSYCSLKYFYKNETESSKPMYIGLVTDIAAFPAGSHEIQVQYYDKTYFEKNILSEINKKKNEMDNL